MKNKIITIAIMVMTITGLSGCTVNDNYYNDGVTNDYYGEYEELPESVGPTTSLYNGDNVTLSECQFGTDYDYITQDYYNFKNPSRYMELIDNIELTYKNSSVNYNILNKNIVVSSDNALSYEFEQNEPVKFSFVAKDKNNNDIVFADTMLNTNDKDTGTKGLKAMGITIYPRKGLIFNQYEFRNDSMLDFVDYFGEPDTAIVGYNKLHKKYTCIYKYEYGGRTMCIHASDKGEIQKILISYIERTNKNG